MMCKTLIVPFLEMTTKHLPGCGVEKVSTIARGSEWLLMTTLGILRQTISSPPLDNLYLNLYVLRSENELTS